MSKRVLNPTTVARPMGDYSQAVVAGGFLYIAGQVALDPSGNFIGAEDVRVQTRQVMWNIGHILEAAGATFDDVVKLTTLLTNMEDRLAVAQVRREFLTRDFPAAILFEVPRLAIPEAKVEVEAVAILPTKREAE